LVPSFLDRLTTILASTLLCLLCTQQNFGAILRSGWCLGAAGLLVSSKNCAPLSPAVSKASAGAMEAAEVHAARMLRDTLVVGMAIHALGCERVCVVITSIQV